MRVLIYKMTHDGDPDPNGCFGAQDCMGRIRERDFDAVIGIGGMGREAQSYGFAGNVVWVGIGPYKTAVRHKRGPEVRFQHFVDFGSDGPKFRQVAPKLGRRIYLSRMRHLMLNTLTKEHFEIVHVLALAEEAPASPGLSGQRGEKQPVCRRSTKCRKKKRC
jgi:hypothetical protein